ncbi:MAG: peroxidase family protein [Bacteroidota bacterium]
MENYPTTNGQMSYHGKHAAYSVTTDGQQVCYFNPFYEAGKLKESSFRYLFPELAKRVYNDLYKKADTAPLIEHLKALADIMNELQADEAGDLANNSQIPAGFTYFGQFIDHDLTAGTDRSHPFEILKKDFEPVHPHTIVRNLRNMRTPFFDLDSVYGGPGLAYQTFPQFYQKNDQIKLVLGKNESSPPGERPDPELDPPTGVAERDLPRLYMLTEEERNKIPGLKGALPTQALIGDTRNDENLIVAQFHLAFLKAHNRLVDEIRASRGTKEKESPEEKQAIFLAARQQLTLIYQWLVLEDYLPRILNEEVLTHIREFAGTIFDCIADRQGNSGEVFMPLEFSTAAFRFGHSMVRSEYDFNRNFGRPLPGKNPREDRADFTQLFAFTGRGAEHNTDMKDKLPENWIIEWDRFFSDRPAEKDRFTRKIDTRLTERVSNMANEDFSFLSTMEKEEVKMEHGTEGPEGGKKAECIFNKIMKHLARRNLLRGLLLNMVSGQVLARHINRQDWMGGFKLKVLSKSKVKNPAVENLNDLLEKAGFLNRTPLWYYLLREAEVQENGQRLGHLGSWLVGHTLVGLMKKSPTSVFSADSLWTPAASKLASVQQITSVMDFLVFAGVAPSPTENT